MPGRSAQERLRIVVSIDKMSYARPIIRAGLARGFDPIAIMIVDLLSTVYEQDVVVEMNKV